MLLVRAASASGAQRFTEGDSRRNIPPTNTVTVIGIFFCLVIGTFCSR